MSSMFGNFFMSKEDKERKYEAYSKKIFPYGDEQRKKVSALLSETFPEEKLKYLMMHYILIKECMIGEEKLDFDTAARKIAKKKIIRITPELEKGIHAILEADLSIDEKLEYPLAEDLLE